MEEAPDSSNRLKVLMFPWLAYGHISPFLELAKKLIDRGFFIYLCSTPVNLASLKNKIAPKQSLSIQLVELHLLPDFPELPPSRHTTNGLPNHLLPTLKSALHKSQPNLSKILTTLNPHLLIYDIIQSWAAALAARHNIPALRFATSSAAMLAYICHMGLRPGIEFPFPAIYFSDYEKSRSFTDLESARKDSLAVDDPVVDQMPQRFCDRVSLIKTSREFDGKYIDYVSDLFQGTIVPVCPLLQDPINDCEDDADNELIQWLGKKSENSSVFVSFGSEYFLTKEEVEEIALGLELSNVNFIWVLRFPNGDRTTLEEALSRGFLDRTKDRGRVVEGWAPQAKILRHRSIGGFVTHCGWSSLLESVENGVPIIAMPMLHDQPLNARLMVENGVAVEVLRDTDGRRRREDIGKVIEDVVMGKTGENLGRKIKDLGERLRARDKEDFDEVVNMLTKLCTGDSN